MTAASTLAGPTARTALTALTVYYDGACPVCALEIDALGRRCRSGELGLVDISAAGFDAGRHGFDAGDLDAVIHAVAADGTVLRGMDALRAAYAAAGLGGVLRWTGRRPVRSAFDAGYRVFARHRRSISRFLGPLIGVVARARRDGRSDAGDATAADSATVPATRSPS